MPKKTTILIVILALITGVLILLAVKSDSTKDLVKNLTPVTDAPSPTKIQPYVDLGFNPVNVDASIGSATKSVDIVVDSKNKLVSGVQIELSYDPKVVSGVAIKQPTQNAFFGSSPTILINSIDAVAGRVSYAVAISGADSEKTGTGSIATLSFTVNRFAGINSTQISFLPKSAATSLTAVGSVLNSSVPLQVKLTPTQQ